MCNLQLMLLSALFTLTIFPQFPSRLEQDWLFKLSSSSDIAVIGTIIKSEGIKRRLSAQELSTLDDLSKVLGGTLYTLRVEAVIGAKSDFKPGQSRPKLAGQVLHIFVDRWHQSLPQGFYRGFYIEKQSYLVFLKVLPEQTNLTKVFELSEGTTYYGANAGGEGPIQIIDRNSSTLSKIRDFLRALGPTSKEEKLKLLEPLVNSPDEELSQSAKSAITLIEANARQ